MAFTELREAAQQALGAMRCAVPTGKITLYAWGKAMAELEAALVEDALQKFSDVNQELMAALGCDHCNQPLYAAIKCRVCGRVTEPVQEPVWVCPDSAEHRYQKPGHCEDCGKTLVQERHFCPRCGKRTNGIHTCTPPAPLTDEVIADLWHQNGGFHHHFARAIERWLKGNP